jgi:hypothetical protein
MVKFWKSKKFYIGFGVVLAAGVLALIGILKYKRPDTYQIALDNIAEARFYLKSAAENPIARVQFYSGMREDPYEQNGIANTTKAFTVVSVEPKDEMLGRGNSIPAEITVDDITTPITLTKNPYGSNFACDLEKLIDSKAEVKLTIKADEQNPQTLRLEAVLPENAITWEQALEIATKELGTQITDSENLETYIKIICDKQSANLPFWYISFANDKAETFFIVIAMDGHIVGKSK